MRMPGAFATVIARSPVLPPNAAVSFVVPGAMPKMRPDRGFTATAGLTLGLGIGGYLWMKKMIEIEP